MRAFIVCVFQRKELQHQHGYFLFHTLLSVGLGAWVRAAPRGVFQAVEAGLAVLSSEIHRWKRVASLSLSVIVLKCIVTVARSISLKIHISEKKVSHFESKHNIQEHPEGGPAV